MEVTSERLTIGKFSQLIENEHLARYRFAAQLVSGKNVADIACGTGYGAQLLAEAGAKSVHGIDISDEAIQFARENFSSPKVRFTTASAENLKPIPDCEFDVVVSFETIEHLPNVEAYLSEIARILKPGGQYLVSTPDRRIGSVLYPFTRRPANHFHVREFTRKEMIRMLGRKFRVEACFGQSFISRALVCWPVQILIKSACRLAKTPVATNFKDTLYSNGGNVEVLPCQGQGLRVAKYWLFQCVRASD